MAKAAEIVVASDFSRFPAGRFRSDGPASGELFRDRLLVPALKANDSVLVVLDGTLGYGSSFLEEAFGGLVRLCGMDERGLRAKLSFRSRDPSLPREIWSYITSARPVRQAL
jgi:hypothetical protein